jgi:hypothetical protein
MEIPVPEPSWSNAPSLVWGIGNIKFGRFDREGAMGGAITGAVLVAIGAGALGEAAWPAGGGLLSVIGFGAGFAGGAFIGGYVVGAVVPANAPPLFRFVYGGIAVAGTCLIVVMVASSFV